MGKNRLLRMMQFAGSEDPAYSLTNSMHLTGSQAIENIPSVNGDRRSFTYATWLKINPGTISSFGTLLCASKVATAVDDTENLWYGSVADEFLSYLIDNGTEKLFNRYTTNIDSSDGWVHVCAQKNTDALTYTLEINSVVSGFTVTVPFVDNPGWVGSANGHLIGGSYFGPYRLYAKLADTHLVIGANYDSSYFVDAELNPIAFTESHGTNGGHFLYQDSQNMGKNEAGDDWTAINNPIQSTDVP